MSLMPMPERRLVPAEGNPSAKICIIGEAPSTWELRELRPFVGPAGGVLEQCLHAAGLLRDDCYITNLFKFKVDKNLKSGAIIDPDTREVLWDPRKGFSAAGERYRQELLQELEELGANVFVPMGNAALDALVGERSILKWRGSILGRTFCSNIEHKVIGTIHPAATLRGTYLHRFFIIFDLKRAREESEYPEVVTPDLTLHINPSFEEALYWLKHVYKLGLEGHRVNFDIEIMNQEISCIGFAVKDWQEAYCIPIHGAWDREQEMAIWDYIALIIEDPKVALVNQNILFDLFVLAYKNNIIGQGRLDDPMTANHIIYPDFPKDLGTLTSIHTKIPYFKDDGKVWKLSAIPDPDKFYRYNAQDNCASLACMDSLDRELDEQEFRKQYEETMDLYPVLLAMMLEGFHTDQKGIADTGEEYKTRLEDAQRRLDEMLGFELNVGSSKQCCDYFYVVKGLKPYMNQGRPTCDDLALARLAKGTASRPGLPEAKIMQEIRTYKKLLSSYFSIVFDEDGRFRCSINPRGTVSGRLSTGKTLFGTGTNMQNQTPIFKQFLIPPPGHFLAEIDKSQAEWVVTAYIADDANMIEVIEKGLDAHARTGELITGVPMDIIKKEAKIIGNLTEPMEIKQLREEHFPGLIENATFLPRTMSIRQCGKKANHGLNYGMMPPKYALINEVLLKEAEYIVNAYHAAYPGLRANFYEGVKKQLAEDRTLTNCFGDKRRFLGQWGQDLFNQAFDYIPQSTVAKLINSSLVAISKDPSMPLRKLRFIIQVHDSIVIAIPLEDMTSAATALLLCCEHLDPDIHWRSRSFRIKTDVKVGYNWREMEELKLHEISSQSLSKVLLSKERECQGK